MLWLTERFAADFRSVGAARRAALQTLEARDLLRLVDDASTVVSELATNAVLHAKTEFTLSLGPTLGGDGLRVSVADGSAVQPRVRRFGGPDSTTGRGLQMVAALSSAWGVLPTAAGGKETWCELRLAAADDAALRHGRSRTGVAPGAGSAAPSTVDVEALLSQFDDLDPPPPAGRPRGSVPG